jgi:hypothetical protein
LELLFQVFFFILLLLLLSLLYSGSACFSIYPNFSSIYYGDAFSACLENQYDFGENSIIELELNMNFKSLNFFYNNKLLSYVVDNISSSSLYFFISGYCTNSTVEVISFLKLRKPSFSMDNTNSFKKFRWE